MGLLEVEVSAEALQNLLTALELFGALQWATIPLERLCYTYHPK
jgi:hypothetical protein